MIRFGLRLTLRGGREAATRLVLIGVAVAIGTALLLITLGGINAVNSQNARFAWLETASDGVRPNPPATAGAPASSARATGDPTWWRLSGDRFHGSIIGRVDVAATGPHPPLPPGMHALPGPGEFYASPAMARLLAATPADELAGRYPGHLVGTIGDAALPSPDSLIIVIGHTPGELAHADGARLISGISTTPPNACNGACYLIGIDARGMDLVLSVVAAALLFPILIFIATATRLSAARREQRFAALRLVGATPRQISVISTVESTVATAIGVAWGFGIFYAVRPFVAQIPFTGSTFFTGDIAPNLPDVLLVVAGLPLGAAVAARIALRRVTISPLGVTRRTTPPKPSPARLLLLLAGIAELGYFYFAGRPATTGGQILAYLPGVLVMMAGLVFAGPWLTFACSKLLAGRARRPAALIAGRRLSDNPHAGFRAVSGLVLALFVTSVSVGIISTMQAYDGGARSTPADRATLVEDLYSADAAGAITSSITAVPASVMQSLRAVPGVGAILEVHELPPRDPGMSPGVASCAALAALPALGACQPGAATANVWPGIAGSRFQPATWPTTRLAAADLARLPLIDLAVSTDGSRQAVERTRSLLERSFPRTDAPRTIAEQQADQGAKLTAYRRLATVVIVATLPIAGCTLAVSIVAGLNERKRPFSLLRLTGAPLAMLRRVVVLESALPLLAAAVASVGAGLLAAYLFLHSQLSERLQPLGATFYVAVVAGILASLAIIASTLPMLGRISGPETARNE